MSEEVKSPLRTALLTSKVSLCSPEMLFNHLQELRVTLTAVVLAAVVYGVCSLPTSQPQEDQDELMVKHVTSPLIEGRMCRLILDIVL